MYSIVVTAGPSLDESQHECVHVNSESFVPISNEHFQGQVTVRVKDFSGKAPEGKEPIPQSEYFDGEGKDNTFSIEATGIYKTEGLTADDLLFGIVFRHSIVDRLPSSYPLAIKALKWFNPNIDFNLESSHPTVLAPFLSIVSRATFTSASSIPALNTPPVPSTPLISSREEDITLLINAQNSGSRAAGALESDKDLLRGMLPASSEYSKSHEPVKGWFGKYAPPSRAELRQKWFSDEEVRKETVVGNECITTDWRNGFMEFKNLSLNIPGFPFTISLGQYMKGRPVQYCCMSRDGTKTYWTVIFTIIDGPDLSEGSSSESGSD